MNQLSLGVAYLIFFTQFISLELNQVGLNTPRFTSFMIALIPIVPLTMVNNVHYFHQTSTLGMLLAFLGIAVTIVYGWIMIFDSED